MQDDTLHAIASALIEARRTGTAADETPFKDAELAADDVYAVHAEVAAALGWNASPDRPSHWKGGGPTPASTAVFARLPEPWVQPSPGRLGARDFHRLGIEIEVAFRLARDVTAEDLAARGTHDASALLDAMAVTIELVDFRWQGAEHAPNALKLADLQSNGALVVGEWTPIRAVDWAAQTAALRIDGCEVGRHRGAHPCGDPLWMTSQWLQHAVLREGGLAAGSVLTTGSWCGMAWLDGPARVDAVFDGIGEARLTID